MDVTFDYGSIDGAISETSKTTTGLDYGSIPGAIVFVYVATGGSTTSPWYYYAQQVVVG